MSAPLQHSIHHPGCNYYGAIGRVCMKCGKVVRDPYEQLAQLRTLLDQALAALAFYAERPVYEDVCKEPGNNLYERCDSIAADTVDHIRAELERLK